MRSDNYPEIFRKDEITRELETERAKLEKRVRMNHFSWGDEAVAEEVRARQLARLGIPKDEQERLAKELGVDKSSIDPKGVTYSPVPPPSFVANFLDSAAAQAFKASADHVHRESEKRREELERDRDTQIKGAAGRFFGAWPKSLGR